jgi:hypothetical protein
MRTPSALRGRVVLALLAILAQLVVPHLHRLQVTGHATPATQEARQRTTSARTAFVDVGDAAASHTESSCAICQALAASHDFLVAAAHHAIPAANPLARIALLEARTAQAPAGPHAARSPPHTA